MLSIKLKIKYLLPKPERFTIVVMKFHSNQNLPKNTELATNNPISNKLRTKPTPSLGKSLKLTFKYPNKLPRKTNVKIDIKITIKMVNIAGGSIRCSGGFVRIMDGNA